ncbi:MAG: winged helix-turn-helix transcriptional regulator [archaeon]|nr:winged helix-turn-helix transcriptional regulator [archaeon]
MDEIDIAISIILLGDSRIPYSRLSKQFDISVNSIHKRIKSLVKQGCIKNFFSRLSLSYFKGTIVILYGRSNTKNMKMIGQELGKNENIYWVARASGKYLFIGAYIQNFNDLEPIVNFVKKKGEIDNLKVGLMPGYSSERDEKLDNVMNEKKYEKKYEKKLSKLDYQIIYSLKDNSRKPLSDVADELGTTMKTVKRRLNNMIKNEVAEFSIDWSPDDTNDVISIFILKLKPGKDKNQIITDLRKQFSPNYLFSYVFSNLPDEILGFVWSKKMRVLNELEDILSEEFDSVNLLIIYNGEYYNSWRDTYLETKIQELKEN